MSAEKEIKKTMKGRPTCKKEIEDEKRKPLKDNNPKYKFLNLQMEKLENMYVILTAEDGMRKLALKLRNYLQNSVKLSMNGKETLRNLETTLDY